MTAHKIELLSPDGLHKTPAYSQVAVVEGNTRTIYTGGQNAVDKDENSRQRRAVAVLPLK